MSELALLAAAGDYTGTTIIRLAREDTGMSRAQMAKELGWPMSKLWAVEVGKHPPTEEEARALFRVPQFRTALRGRGVDAWETLRNPNVTAKLATANPLPLLPGETQVGACKVRRPPKKALTQRKPKQRAPRRERPAETALKPERPMTHDELLKRRAYRSRLPTCERAGWREHEIIFGPSNDLEEALVNWAADTISGPINTYLRGGHLTDFTWNEVPRATQYWHPTLSPRTTLSRLQRWMRPSTTTTRAYRGVALKEPPRVGSVMEDKGLVSITWDFDAAYSFAEGRALHTGVNADLMTRFAPAGSEPWVLDIIVPAGTQGMNIYDQAEWLINTARYRIESVNAASRTIEVTIV